MARNKTNGVAEGFDFSVDTAQEPEVKITPQVPEKKATQNDDASNSRTYSKYYEAHPKKGKRGGTLGKPAVDENDRKRSVSIQLSNNQKERYNEAAKKDRRKWPDFVVVAIEEYIENHNLE